VIRTRAILIERRSMTTRSVVAVTSLGAHQLDQLFSIEKPCISIRASVQPSGRRRAARRLGGAWGWGGGRQAKRGDETGKGAEDMAPQ
jgi:hypothetical protein